MGPACRGPLRAFGLASCTLAVLASVAIPAAAAHTQRLARIASVDAPPPPSCVVHSLPSFVAQGEFATAATAADVVEVECNPTVYGTGSKIKVTASQLFSRCKGDVTWYIANPFHVESGRGVSLELDADGNATVALIAGPGCSAGESLVSAHMEEAPFETFTTSFTVLPPADTTSGVFTLPASQVEDADSSAVATIIETEFKGGSEKKVHIGSEELFDRCRVAPHLTWVRMDRTMVAGQGEVEGVELDNNGNAFVLAIGNSSCAEGPSLIEADLESKPFTTFTTNFDVLPPQPTGEPTFTIEKRQTIAGSGAEFTTAKLTAPVGLTVDYEIIVKNTSDVAETFSELIDPHCDAGSLAGGPGSNPLAPGASTTFTCDRLLGAPGTYVNEGTITAMAPTSTPITQTSNAVVAEAISPIIEPHGGSVPSQPASATAPAANGAAPRRGQAARCEASKPAVHGASGPKLGPFTLQIAARGLAQITYYVDGHKVGTLKQSQARHGQFDVKIDPRKLTYGAHKVSIKALATNHNCAQSSVSSVFVHAHSARVEPKFTG